MNLINQINHRQNFSDNMAANMAASMRKARKHGLNMAAERKGNEGEILNFPNFCCCRSNFDFPQL